MGEYNALSYDFGSVDLLFFKFQEINPALMLLTCYEVLYLCMNNTLPFIIFLCYHIWNVKNVLHTLLENTPRSSYLNGTKIGRSNVHV